MAFAYSEQTNVDRIVYRAKISWWIYAVSVLLIFIGLVAVAVSAIESLDSIGVGVIILIVGLCIFIKNFIYVFSTELYITQKFTIAKYGLIKRDTIEMLK